MENFEKVGDEVYALPNGEVRLATDRRNQSRVSVRKKFIQANDNRIRLQYGKHIENLLTSSECFYCLRLIHHAIVLEEERDVLYLVFEHLGFGLYTFLYKQEHSQSQLHAYFQMGSDRKYHLSRHSVQSFLYQLCKGVDFMHKRKIPHGLTRSSIHKHEIWYRAPEALLNDFIRNPYALDMWSVGCIFAEMVFGKRLFEGNSEFEQLIDIFWFLGPPTEERLPGVSRLMNLEPLSDWIPQIRKPRTRVHLNQTLGHDGVSLLLKMLVYNPAKRISAAEALIHPFFDAIDKSQY